MNCKVFDKKILPEGVEIFLSKPEGHDLARAVGAYL
jgi:hypothetical protein